MVLEWLLLITELVINIYIYSLVKPWDESILWRKEYERFITPINFEVDWRTGIMFNQNGKKYAVLSVYMSFESKANEDKYIEKIGVLHAILSELQASYVSVLGEWNADTSDRDTTEA